MWGKLADPAGAQLLLGGRPCTWRRLLSRSDVHLVLLNGATAVRAAPRHGAGGASRGEEDPRSQHHLPVLTGEGRGISYVGWSTNLQTSFGVSNEFKQRLAQRSGTSGRAWSATDAGLTQAPAKTSRAEIDGNGFFPRG